jgi:hypothetical protein
LVLLGSKLVDAASQDIEIGRQGRKLLHGSVKVAAAVGDFDVGADNNHASAGARATSVGPTTSPYDCRPSVSPTPMSTAIENLLTKRNTRLKIDGKHRKNQRTSSVVWQIGLTALAGSVLLPRAASRSLEGLPHLLHGLSDFARSGDD